jgi:hypothetical protein
MPEPLDINASYVPCLDAMESRLGEETVILHLGSGVYFGLDAVGTLVWEAMAAGQADTPASLCAHVRASFSDAPDTVEADVTAFLERLVAHDLIRRA